MTIGISIIITTSYFVDLCYQQIYFDIDLNLLCHLSFRRITNLYLDSHTNLQLKDKSYLGN